MSYVSNMQALRDLVRQVRSTVEWHLRQHDGGLVTQLLLDHLGLPASSASGFMADRTHMVFDSEADDSMSGDYEVRL